MEEIEVGGCTIRYRLAGQGPLAVLLHSSSSHSGQFKPLIEALAPDFTCLAPDLHGYGRSDPLPDEGRPFFLRDGAAVAALIRRHGTRAHLVGHSMGGVLALRVAHDHPDLAASLTLIEPVQFSLLQGGDPALRLEVAEVSSEVAAHLHFRAPRAAARAFIDFWVGQGAFDAMDPKTAGYIAATASRIADDWSGVSAFAPGQITPADCAALSLPCRLLAGEKTRAPARAVAESLAAAIPGATLRILPGARHMAAATDPARVNPAIREFLREQPR